MSNIQNFRISKNRHGILVTFDLNASLIRFTPNASRLTPTQESILDSIQDEINNVPPSDLPRSTLGKFKSFVMGADGKVQVMIEKSKKYFAFLDHPKNQRQKQNPREVILQTIASSLGIPSQTELQHNKEKQNHSAIVHLQDNVFTVTLPLPEQENNILSRPSISMEQIRRDLLKSRFSKAASLFAAHKAGLGINREANLTPTALSINPEARKMTLTITMDKDLTPQESQSTRNRNLKQKLAHAMAEMLHKHKTQPMTNRRQQTIGLH